MSFGEIAGQFLSNGTVPTVVGQLFREINCSDWTSSLIDSSDVGHGFPGNLKAIIIFDYSIQLELLQFFQHQTETDATHSKYSRQYDFAILKIICQEEVLFARKKCWRFAFSVHYKLQHEQEACISFCGNLRDVIGTGTSQGFPQKRYKLI